MLEYTFGSNAAVNTLGVTLAQSGAVGCTLNFLNPAAAPAYNIEFLRHWVGQSANATSAQQRIALVTQPTAFPTLTTMTPKKLKFNDPASAITGGTAGAAGTCGINASAEGAGTKVFIWDDSFNVLNGYLSVATPPETYIIPAGATSGVGLWVPIVPTTGTGWNWGQNYRQV